MCGINGILRLVDTAPRVEREAIVRTRDAMASRGPDGEGLWLADDGGLGLGHRRLAIIDLSKTGSQPMAFDGGRFRLVFNGEIYNYRELRAGLERDGVRFVSTSDSEVILALFAREGTAMLPRLRGMYALALWDARERTLVLARDPYGIKPLYLAATGGWLEFASQVKALEAGGRVSVEPDPVAIVEFLLWGSIQEPRTIRKEVRAVPAGHHVVVRGGRVEEPRPHRLITDEGEGPAPGLGEALADSVRAHLVADVPVAVFLSAGIDSSLVAAVARREAGEGLTTLTMRFEDFLGTANDEGPFAAETAKALGTRHVERVLTRSDLRDLWPRVLGAMDQPSIDGFNTYVISRAAHEAGFKVVLSGLGGDELLGGYGTFRDVPRLRRRAATAGWLPGIGSAWPAIARRIVPGKPKLAGLFQYGRSLGGAYFLRRGLFLPAEIPAIVGRDVAREGMLEADPLVATARATGGAAPPDDWTAIHLLESSIYMRNQLLRDSDWASMAHSLELRVPLADARLREQAAHGGFEPARTHGKAAAAMSAAPELPTAVWTRPKTGFSIPFADAILGPDPRRRPGGAASRPLAVRVLRAFGVALPPSSGGHAA